MATPTTSLAEQPYEPFAFARKHGLPIQRAREIVERYGNDREGADAAALSAAVHSYDAPKGLAAR